MRITHHFGCSSLLRRNKSRLITLLKVISVLTMIQRNVTRLFYLRGLQFETFMRGKFKVLVMEIMVKCLTDSGKLWLSHSRPVEGDGLSDRGLISTSSDSSSFSVLLLFKVKPLKVNTDSIAFVR